jgi:hypothetical protein
VGEKTRSAVNPSVFLNPGGFLKKTCTGFLLINRKEVIISAVLIII